VPCILYTAATADSISCCRRVAVFAKVDNGVKTRACVECAAAFSTMPQKKTTCSELRQLLTSAGIPFRSKLSKSELQQLVQEHLSEGGVPAFPDDDESDGGEEDDQHDLLGAFDDEHDIAEALRLLKQG
jgi:hypothetical protein